MINIRRNVFETNSSSIHSLVITKQSRQYTKEELALEYDPECHETFELWRYCDNSDMTYERSPFQILATPLEKLRYYSAYTLGTYKKPAKKDVDKIKNFVMKQTGITDPDKIRLYKIEDWWSREKHKNKNYGAVYSNDTGEDPMAFVKRKGIDWEDLILNPKYIIIVDGDEIQDFKTLIDARIINTDTFEDISSGIDFWNDANHTIYINWLRPEKGSTEVSYLEYIEAIDDKTKTLDFTITNQEEVRLCKKVIKVIKNIIKLAKEKKSDIKTKLIIDNWTEEELDYSSIDQSIFDEVIVENNND